MLSVCLVKERNLEESLLPTWTLALRGETRFYSIIGFRQAVKKDGSLGGETYKQHKESCLIVFFPFEKLNGDGPHHMCSQELAELRFRGALARTIEATVSHFYLHFP